MVEALRITDRNIGGEIFAGSPELKASQRMRSIGGDSVWMSVGEYGIGITAFMLAVGPITFGASLEHFGRPDPNLVAIGQGLKAFAAGSWGTAVFITTDVMLIKEMRFQSKNFFRNLLK